ncbi:MAG: serine protein kinase RIO [Candidatus Woesearchaeota archaeon]
MARITREKFKTSHTVFDDFTNRNIMKLISEGHFDGLVGPVFVGKESNVFSAKKGRSLVIVKIYRLETCDFNRMYDYIKSDSRYTHLKKRSRQIIFAWAQREYRNLLLARQAGVRVPTPITFKYNILVMELIGDTVPSPKLKDCIPANPKRFLGEVISLVKSLYASGLVHGDLSSFNILNLNEKPVFIDFSQATTTNSPLAKELLHRDIHNVATFFAKHGVNLDKELVLEDILR